MLSHNGIWSAIDRLAANNGYSPSGLAKKAGLDPTIFNKSKRFNASGRPRWPSTESIAKILDVANTTPVEFFGNACTCQSRPKRVPFISEAYPDLAHYSCTACPLTTTGEPVALPLASSLPLYALGVDGEALRPVYRRGDILFVTVADQIAPGDKVVVKLPDQTLSLKTLADSDANTLSFASLNAPDGGTVVPRDRLPWMAKVVYATQ